MGVEESENFVPYLVRFGVGVVLCLLEPPSLIPLLVRYIVRSGHVIYTVLRLLHIIILLFTSHHPCESMLTNQRIELKSIRSKIQYLARLLVRVFIARTRKLNVMTCNFCLRLSKSNFATDSKVLNQCDVE